MLHNLLNSKKAKKEIQKFEKELQGFTNVEAQKRGFDLLAKLKRQSIKIDFIHSTDSVTDINNEKIRENIESLVKVRSELYKLIKDAKS